MGETLDGRDHLVQRRAAGHAQLVAGMPDRTPRGDDVPEVDRSSGDDDVGRCRLDRLRQLGQLLVRVPERRQDGPDVGLPRERLRDRADRVGARVDELAGQSRPSGHGAGPERHPAVREGGAVLDHEHAPPLEGRAGLERHG